MVAANTLMYIAFAVLLLLSVLMGQQVFEAGLQTTADKQFEHYTKILLGILSGLGAAFVLYVKQQTDGRQRRQDAAAKDAATQQQFAHEEELVLLRGAIEHLTATAAKTEEARMGALSEFARRHIAEQFEPKLKQLEVAAESLSKYNELMYADDFKRRERRYATLVDLSRTLYRTTRAFVTLCSYRLAPNESSDSLVSVLTTALTNREAFLAAREDLLILHMVESAHAETLRKYSRRLTEIIIDVRQLDPSGPGDQIEEYERKMKAHAVALQDLSNEMGKVLEVFLAPQLGRPEPPGGGRSRSPQVPEVIAVRP